MPLKIYAKVAGMPLGTYTLKKNKEKGKEPIEK
jgi:hypothetical protein